MADLVAIAVATILDPLVAEAKRAAEPVLRFVPDVIVKEAEAALIDFTVQMVRAGVLLLMARGMIKIETSGEITLRGHAGAHPEDVT